MSMNVQHGVSWELLREYGLEYAPSYAPRAAVELSWPVLAERIAGVGYLLVDESLEYNPPIRTHCRTLLLSEARAVIYDSRARNIHDAFGCRMDQERFAILRRARREILVLSASGECFKRIDLSRVSAHPPRILCWTGRKTFLVNFATPGLSSEIVEVDLQGRVLWNLVGASGAVRLPGSMQLLENDSILIANERAHVVEELHRDGSTAIRWGKQNLPSAEQGSLFSPKWAQQLDNGTLLIADAFNHRCLAIDVAGRVSTIQPNDASFLIPSAIAPASDGNYLICDAGLRCVLELDAMNRILWQVGVTRVRKRYLSFPRSVQRLDGGVYVIADTAHNRIVEFDGALHRESRASDGASLLWPRAARRTGKGTTLVADGRNSRILELAADGRMLRQLSVLRYGGQGIELEDPHDVRLLPNLNLLVTDSAANLVFESDWRGNAVWVVGPVAGSTVEDPHSAQMLSDGRIMISDSGNHRILFVDPRTGTSLAMTEFQSRTARYPLSYPRYAEVAEDGTLVVVDSHNNRVLGADLDGNLLWELSRVPRSPLPFLHFPRWAHALSRDEVVVSDHFNHRIVHVRRLS